MDPHLREHVEESTLIEAGFGQRPEPITATFPPYASHLIYIGRPRPGASIVLVEAMRGERTDWYLDVIYGKRWNERTEYETKRFFDQVRMMVPLGKKVAPESLDERIHELAEKLKR